MERFQYYEKIANVNNILKLQVLEKTHVEHCPHAEVQSKVLLFSLCRIP